MSIISSKINTIFEISRVASFPVYYIVFVHLDGIAYLKFKFKLVETSSSEFAESSEHLPAGLTTTVGCNKGVLQFP